MNSNYYGFNYIYNYLNNFKCTYYYLHLLTAPDNHVFCFDSLQEYVEAVCAGKLCATEIRATKLIAQGAMRHDSICRAVVPALISKADKIRRGRTTRTGTSDVDQTGLVELSFALGQSLNIAAVQKALGLSRCLECFRGSFSFIFFQGPGSRWFRHMSSFHIIYFIIFHNISIYVLYCLIISCCFFRQAMLTGMLQRYYTY